jgi:hypothetical protein
MHIKLTNGIPEKYTIRQLRRDNPQVSFPTEIPDATLAEYSVYPLAATPMPAYDPETQRVSEGLAELVDGVWMQTWVVTDLTPEELAERAEVLAREARQERNRLLAESDWTQLSDAPVDAGIWAVYRQALRDITGQPEFPWAVLWPTKPE